MNEHRIYPFAQIQKGTIGEMTVLDLLDSAKNEVEGLKEHLKKHGYGHDSRQDRWADAYFSSIELRLHVLKFPLTNRNRVRNDRYPTITEEKDVHPSSR